MWIYLFTSAASHLKFVRARAERHVIETRCIARRRFTEAVFFAVFVRWIVCLDADQRNFQGSVSLAFVRGIHRWPVDSPHKGPVPRKMFQFDDVIMLIAKFSGGGVRLRGLSAYVMPNQLCIWVFCAFMSYVWKHIRADSWFTPSQCEISIVVPLNVTDVICSFNQSIYMETCL